MRLLIVFVAIFALGSCAVYIPLKKATRLSQIVPKEDLGRAFEETINSTLECIREILAEGDESIGLPSHEPMYIEDKTHDLDALGLENISGYITIQDFSINGITKWITSHLKGTVTVIPAGAKFEITMEWPEADLSGNYEADVTVAGTNFQGSGTVKGNLVNLVIEVKLHGTLLRIGLESFSFRPSVEDVEAEITGLNANGEDVSEKISDVISNFEVWLAENIDLVDETISAIIMNIVNNGEGGGGGEHGDVLAIILERCLDSRRFN